VFFAVQLPRSDFDNDVYRFIPKDDPARKTADYIDNEFGSSNFILIALEQEQDDRGVFSPDLLRNIQKFVQHIELMNVVKEVTSIVNADYITAEEDSIVVKKLVGDDFTGSTEQIAELKHRVSSWDLYSKALVSDDFTATQILVSLNLSNDSNKKSEEVTQYMQIRSLAHEMFDSSATVYVTGMPVITATLTEYMKKDLVLLVPLVIIVVLAILFFFFRRIQAVLITFFTVIVATIWTMGALPLFGMKLSIISSVLPVVLIAVGSAYGILVMTFYLGEIKNQINISRTQHNELVISMLKRIWKSVFLAALTTFAGFTSFCFTTVVPIQEWGIFASFGVCASFIVALTLIPALLMIRGPKPMKVFEQEQGGHETARGAFTGILLSVARKKRFVVGATLVVTVFSAIAVTKLIVDNVFIEYFQVNTEIVRSDKFIREKFGGSKVVNLVMEADSPEILLMPEPLLAMDGLKIYLSEHSVETGKILAFTDMVKRVNQVFNANEDPAGIQRTQRNVPLASVSPVSDAGFGFGFGDSGGTPSPALPQAPDAGLPLVKEAKILDKTYSVGQFMGLLDQAMSSGNTSNPSSAQVFDSLKKIVNYNGASYYEIPFPPERYGKNTPEELQSIVANYLALISGSISSYANDPLEPKAIKMSIQLRTVGATDTQRAIDMINKYIKGHFPDNIRPIIGGPAMVENSLSHLVVDSQVISLFLSLFVVFLIIMIANKSVVAGCIGLVPLVVSILINFAVMSLLKIKLNIGTSLIAGLAVGIGIDYTIHFMEIYKQEYQKLNGNGPYLQNTFSTVGLAIVINALSVGLGFAVLALSEFTILRELGMFIAQTMGISALVSLTVIPVLMEGIKPKFIRK
jgi:predicted RND superfamily exporter protein